MNEPVPSTMLRHLDELLRLGGSSFRWQVFEDPVSREIAVVGVRHREPRVADVIVLREREVHAYRAPVTADHPDPLRPTKVWRWLSSQDPRATMLDLLDLPAPAPGHLIALPAATGVPAGMRSAYLLHPGPSAR